MELNKTHREEHWDLTKHLLWVGFSLHKLSPPVFCHKLTCLVWLHVASLLKDIGHIYVWGRTDSLEDNIYWFLNLWSTGQILSFVDGRDVPKGALWLIQKGNYYCLGSKWLVFLTERWETREHDREGLTGGDFFGENLARYYHHSLL